MLTYWSPRGIKLFNVLVDRFFIYLIFIILSLLTFELLKSYNLYEEILGSNYEHCPLNSFSGSRQFNYSYKLEGGASSFFFVICNYYLEVLLVIRFCEEIFRWLYGLDVRKEDLALFGKSLYLFFFLF